MLPGLTYRLPGLVLPNGATGTSGIVLILSLTTAQAGTSVVVPSNANYVDIFCRGSGAGGSYYGGGGGAEERVGLSVSPGQILSSTVGAGGAGYSSGGSGYPGSSSFVMMGGQTIVTANGAVSQVGGIASPNGKAGSNGISNGTGGSPGAFLYGVAGGTSGSSGTPAGAGIFGGGGGGNNANDSGAKGGDGVILYIFRGP